MEAPDIHHKSEMMAEIAALRDKYQMRLRVERYVEERDEVKVGQVE